MNSNSNQRLKLCTITHYGLLSYLTYFTMRDVSCPKIKFLYLNLFIVLREDEDRRRREHMMLEEERLRREKDDLDFRY